ncbi:rod shape-determining protein MreC [Mobilisporobacter senegalensis]|uniref:Cell shape-determining protein MreC n=1 Tax=Mobilisporobacter senegalensis TaxID=1329262 RepID=A0A3N1XR45_9FIRM|nr:rod shape-determining protein MreC [Mobilisporobacter senegalensis]ROR29140.1 rod shape-determining protein MreC [Mobilisporobacter senegalensis]
MKRRTRISIEPKYILASCTALCLVIILVSFKYSDGLGPIKTSVGTVLSPMQKGINSIGRYISDRVDDLKNIQSLQSENKKLKEELSTISYENKILQQDKYELENLRNLYQLDQKYASYPKVAARVISKETNNWYNTFLIDKGTEDGLAVDMNVLAGNGLVGIITEAGKNYSRVRSIIDDSSNVSGMFLKTSDTCIVTGSLKLIDSGLIQVSHISKDADVKDGYEIVTSNISDKYLQGILIGYISDITVDANNMTKSGYLTPAVNFNRLDTVLIITELKENTEELKEMMK